MTYHFYINIVKNNDMIDTQGLYSNKGGLWIEADDMLFGIKDLSSAWKCNPEPFLKFIQGDYTDSAVLERDWIVLESKDSFRIEETHYSGADVVPQTLVELPDSKFSMDGVLSVDSSQKQGWILWKHSVELTKNLHLASAKCALLERELSVTKKISIELINTKKARIRELQGILRGEELKNIFATDKHLLHRKVTEGTDSEERVDVASEPSLKRFKSDFGTPKIPQNESFTFKGINRSLTPAPYRAASSASLELSGTRRKLEEEISAQNGSSGDLSSTEEGSTTEDTEE